MEPRAWNIQFNKSMISSTKVYLFIVSTSMGNHIKGEDPLAPNRLNLKYGLQFLYL